MADRLRFGVIGVGSGGLQHLDSLLHSPRGVAVAIAESHPGRAKQAADRYHIPRSYSNYQELLDQPDIDAVTIALPNYLHAKAALAALQVRKHVFLETPFSMSNREATKLIETSKKMRRSLMPARRLRFSVDTQAAHAMVRKGEAGKIYHARCFWLKRSGIPRIGSWYTQRTQAGGGCLADLGADVLDACLHLLGEFDVRGVSAVRQTRMGPRGMGEGAIALSEPDDKRPFDVEDFGTAMLRLKSGRSVLVETSWAGHHAPDARECGIDLMGEAAGVSLFPARLFRATPAGYETIQMAAPTGSRPEDPLHEFAESVLEGRKPPVTADETLRLQKVIDAIYASAKANKEVRLT